MINSTEKQTRSLNAIQTMGAKQYDCSFCNYRDRTINFCGFCTKRMLDELKEAKKRRNELKSNDLSAEIKGVE